MNIYEVLFAIACSLLVVLYVAASPVDLDDELMEREVRGDDLFEEDLENDMEMFRRAENPLELDAAKRAWSKNFMGSSMDSSHRGFTSKHARCSTNDVCKYAGKKMFKCKCSSLQYCVARTPNSDAHCRYSSVGFVFKQ